MDPMHSQEALVVSLKDSVRSISESNSLLKLGVSEVDISWEFTLDRS
jgi:hypothetical protein